MAPFQELGNKNNEIVRFYGSGNTASIATSSTENDLKQIEWDMKGKTETKLAQTSFCATPITKFEIKLKSSQ